MCTLLGKICGSTAGCDTKAEGEERNYFGEMGELCALWRLTVRPRMSVNFRALRDLKMNNSRNA